MLVGDKFMPEMHLKQPGFTYSACGPFNKHAERIKKFMQIGNTSYIYKNELDKACFKHDSAYADYKDLTNRTQADKVLKDRAFEIASNPKYDGYQRGLANMVYKFFDKKSSGGKVKRPERTLKVMLNWLMNYINLLLKSLIKGKCTHRLKIIFGELI